jgi:hypothetical protein
MEIKRILTGLMFTLALVLPQEIHAADFNFNLKTVLSNLHPDVTDIKVSCVAKVSQGDHNSIGGGSTTEKVPASGEFNKNITVKFSATQGANPALAKSFYCDLRLIGPSGTQVPLPHDAGICNNADNDWKCGKQGTTFNRNISGDIP